LTREPSRPSGASIVLDTKPLIKLFAKEEGWKSVRRILTAVEDGMLRAGVCVVTLTEIYYKYLREGREDLGQERVQSIRHGLHIDTLSIDDEIAIKAGEFKGEHAVPVADAFIAAAAFLEGSIVISDDPHFKRIAQIQVLTEEEFVSRPRG
jgi:predicted nucleic acid-binding protein